MNMGIPAANIFILIPVILIILILLIGLQIFLSLQKNKWLGLILPVIYVLFAAFASFGNMLYTGDIIPILVTFFILSIPALINFAIYLACRARVKEKFCNELNKMNIQDLD